MLNTLEKNDQEGQFHCVSLLEWFEYRGHVCMAFERLGLSLYDFLRRCGYLPFQVNLVGVWQSSHYAGCPTDIVLIMPSSRVLRHLLLLIILQQISPKFSRESSCRCGHLGSSCWRALPTCMSWSSYTQT